MRTLIRRGVKRVLRFLLRHVAGKIAAYPVRRRLAEFEADPDPGAPLEEVFARIRRAA